MNRPGARQTLWLAAAAALAAVAVIAFDDETLPRAVAGIVLVLLPWAAAARLDPVLLVDLPGGRFAAAGGLAMASVVLLGLLLTLTGIGLTEKSAAIGVALLAVALALARHAGPNGTDLAISRRPPLLSLLLVVATLAAVVVAFALARGSALDKARRQSDYVAFLAPAPAGQRLGLRNATSEPALFTVQVEGRARRPLRVRLAPDEVRLLPAAVTAGPPAAVSVLVSAAGQAQGPPLRLSTGLG